MKPGVVTSLLHNYHSNSMKVIIILQLMRMQFCHKSLKNDKINIEIPKEHDNEELCITQIPSTKTDTNDSETDKDTEVAEEQIAINKRQELTGDPLPSVLQFENLENQIYQCAPGENNIPQIYFTGQ